MDEMRRREMMRRRRERGGEDYGRRRRDSRGRFMRDYGDYEMDGRRGGGGRSSRRSGGGNRSRRDYGNMPFSVNGEIEYDDYDYADYGDYGDDYGDYDYGEMLSKEDLREWGKHLKNANGTSGEHFDMQQIMSAAQMLNIEFKDFDENELRMTANMLYSDYCDALKNVTPQGKDHILYTKMARAFLEDEDAALKGAEKLAEYYCRIVDPD